MQTGFITALQPFGITPPQVSARRTDEPGQAPAERLRNDQADRDRAQDRAAAPGVGGASRAGLVNGGFALVAQESQSSENEADANGLTEEDRHVVAELKQRDAEVRAHEAAHKAAGGAHAGAISFTYQQGPDGRRYAVGGEVPIDISTVSGDPRATAQKMQQIKRAAMAPADPSGADRAVAAAATKALLEAQAQIASERAAAIAGDNSSKESAQDGAAAEEHVPNPAQGTGTSAGHDEPASNAAAAAENVSNGAPVVKGSDADSGATGRNDRAADQPPERPNPGQPVHQDDQHEPTLSILA